LYIYYIIFRWCFNLFKKYYWTYKIFVCIWWCSCYKNFKM